MQILSIISGKLEKRYEEKSSGVLYINLMPASKLRYDVRVRKEMPQGKQVFGIPFQGFHLLIIYLVY